MVLFTFNGQGLEFEASLREVVLVPTFRSQTRQANGRLPTSFRVADGCTPDLPIIPQCSAPYKYSPRSLWKSMYALRAKVGCGGERVLCSWGLTTITPSLLAGRGHYSRQARSSAGRRSIARCQGKREGDDRPVHLVVGRPEAAPVPFDDRAADGETHAHPVLLGREERLEDARGVLETCSGVANLDADLGEPVTASRIWSACAPSITMSIASIPFRIKLASTCCTWTRSSATGGRSGSKFVSMRLVFAVTSSAISRHTSRIRRLTSSGDLACGA